MKRFISILIFIPFVSKGQSFFELYARPSKVVSSNYTMALFDATLVVNTNSQNDTITLPPASLSYCSTNTSGLVYHIKNIGTNYVYLKPASGDSVEGSVSLFIISPGNASKEVQASTTHSYYIH